MTTAIDWNKDYAHGTFQGAYDIAHRSRYLLISGLLRNFDTVLDVGCGNGLLRQFVNCQYTGIDASSVAINKARAAWSTGDFICADAETWQANRRYDAVVLNEVLYYLNDPLAALRRYAGMVSECGVGLLIVSIFQKRGHWWRRSPNAKAIATTLQFASQFDHERFTVAQDDRSWTVIVIGAMH